MAEELYLTTPEAVPVAYQIAGIGSRFLATVVDTLVLLVLAGVGAIGVLALYSLGDVSRSLALILAGSLLFLLLWGYYALFETFWNGQTPGKRSIGIRVLKTSGYPIGAADALARNLVRPIDFLPGLYGVGLVTMFISSESRRLGDYAAGTVVVRERPPVNVRDLQRSAGRPERAGFAAERGAIDPEELKWNLQALTARDLDVMNAYLERAPQLSREVRQRIGTEIAAPIASRIGAREPLDPTQFLERVLVLRHKE